MQNSKMIGEKIKAIREAKGLTVDQVAQRAGVNRLQIERIESDIEIPSLAPLIKIARTLGVRLGTFLDDQTELGPVLTRAEDCKSRNAIRFTNESAHAQKHMEYHALSQDKAGRHMEPFLIDIDPTANADFNLSSHEGEEFIHVLEGTVEIVYGQDKYTLRAGDSIYYDSIVAHHVHAAAGAAARILGVVYTPF